MKHNEQNTSIIEYSKTQPTQNNYPKCTMNHKTQNTTHNTPQSLLKCSNFKIVSKMGLKFEGC